MPKDTRTRARLATGWNTTSTTQPGAILHLMGRPQCVHCVALTCTLLLYQAECGLIPAQRLPRQSLGHLHPHVRNAHVGHRGSLSGTTRPLRTTECTRYPRKPGYPDTAGHVKPGIADAAEWIWTRDIEQHNDVYCRGNFYNGGR